jgi:eukaryotic-like serine/threonine-protein kinase
MLSHPCPDRFLFRRVLGKGGVGEVLLTLDMKKGEEVALKFVRLAETKGDVVEAEKNGARLQMELAAGAPHVPRVFEEGEDNDFYYFVMEYVAGKDLSDIVAHGPLPEERALHVAIQICDFLARLHSFTSEIGGRKILGVVHGDIKPENIRLQEDDRVRVIDFGIAKQLSLTRSYTRNIFGSLAYLPPERLEQGRVDIHSDLWATGVVLYSMISGHPPYTGTTAGALEREIREHEIVPLPGTCSRGLQWIINKSLSFDVGRRFPTAAAFRNHLKALRDKGSLDHVPEPTAEPSATTRPTREPAKPPPIETPITAPPQAETRRTAPPTSPKVAPNPPTISRETPERETPPKPERRPAVRIRSSPATVVPAKPLGKDRRTRRNLWLAGFVLLGIMTLAQTFTWTEGKRLSREVRDAPLADLLPLWKRYRRITSLNLVANGRAATESTAKRRLREAAQMILEREHENVPRATQPEWDTAEQYLEEALKIGERDSAGEAMLAYARGQKALAEAEALSGQAATDKHAEAVIAFEESTRLDPKWPEPFFGLARALANGKTPDRGKFEALQEKARELGHDDQRLFTMLLANAYLAAGKSLVEQSGPREGPFVRSILWTAFRNLEQAVRRYDEIQDYVPARAQRSEALSLKNRVAGLLADMGGSG